ncbi:MAG: CAP domain-containing protein [Minicystis sp.]
MPTFPRSIRAPLLAAFVPLLAACGGGEGGGSGGGSTTSSGSNDPVQICVDTINQLRASEGLAPYARWTDGEDCTSQETASDSKSGVAHGAFGMCGEHAQNECPGWPSPPEQSIVGCLMQMWAEGPGDDFSTHGHYINMTSTTYTKVACGFYDLGDGTFWAAQNFE